MTDWSELKATVARRTSDVGRLLRKAADGDRQVTGLDWSVAELGAHLVTVPRRFRSMADGQRLTGREDMAALNARMVQEVSERDTEALARRFEDETASLLDALGDDGDEAFNWFDLALRKREATGIVLGEYLIHGLDLARTTGDPWSIERSEALSVLNSLVPVLPHYVNREAVSGLDASIELRLRGRGPLAITIADERATFREGPAQRRDLTISADPVAYLLVGYGRGGPWRSALTGKIVAWGRKPWLTARLPKFFIQP